MVGVVVAALCTAPPTQYNPGLRDSGDPSVNSRTPGVASAANVPASKTNVEGSPLASAANTPIRKTEPAFPATVVWTIKDSTESDVVTNHGDIRKELLVVAAALPVLDVGVA